MQEAGKGVEVEAGDGLTFSFGQTNEHAMTKRHEILAYSSLPPLYTPALLPSAPSLYDAAFDMRRHFHKPIKPRERERKKGRAR